VAISDLNIVFFCGQFAGREPTIFAGQSAGQSAGQPADWPAISTEGLSVVSCHENLDRFHLCSARSEWM